MGILDDKEEEDGVDSSSRTSPFPLFLFQLLFLEGRMSEEERSARIVYA